MTQAGVDVYLNRNLLPPFGRKLHCNRHGPNLSVSNSHLFMTSYRLYASEMTSGVKHKAMIGFKAAARAFGGKLDI